MRNSSAEGGISSEVRLERREGLTACGRENAARFRRRHQSCGRARTANCGGRLPGARGPLRRTEFLRGRWKLPPKRLLADRKKRKCPTTPGHSHLCHALRV